MRTSIAGAAFLLVGAGAATVAALDTNGKNVALNGSDTLFDVTTAVMASCNTQFPDLTTGFAAANVTYQGGGSGVGAGAQGLDLQQIAPASRAYANTEYCFTDTDALDSTKVGAVNGARGYKTNSLMVGIDGVAIIANKTNSCTGTAANGFGLGTAFNVTADGTTGGTAAGTYTFANSFDALKVLYFGLTHDGVYDCASPVRKTLVKQWKNLFSGDCSSMGGGVNCTGGLTHAWRRSDLSGTTDTFVSVLNPPKRGGAGTSVGIGTLPTVPVGAAKKINPFCNTFDAITTPNDGSYPGSFGGSGDFQDLDPVRTKCAVDATVDNDGVCGTGAGANFDGDLGVVLPVLLPDAATVHPLDVYPSTPCLTACVPVAPIRGTLLPNGYKCPANSLPSLGACYMPYAGTSAAPNPQCVSKFNNKCIDSSGKPDGRVYNEVVVVPKTQIPAALQGATNFQFALDANNRIMDKTFYRIHALHAGTGNVPDAAVGQTGICAENDDTSQIGCLVDSDPCSVGYGGREASRSFPGLFNAVSGKIEPQSAPLKALAVNGTPPFTPGANADLALQNLLAPSATPATPLYPLARRLYVTSIYGLGNLMGGEKQLADCFGNNSITTLAVTGRFVPVPGGVQCLDYPEQATSTSTPAANTQAAPSEFTKVLPGCNKVADFGTTGVNACTGASAPTIIN